MKRNSFFVPHRSLPRSRFSAVACKSSFWLALGVTALAGAAGLNGAEVKEGKAAMSDYSDDAPGVVRKIKVSDLPAPYATESAREMARVSDRPRDVLPQVPEGFEVSLFATGFKQPRVLITAPNGDILVADSDGSQVRVLRDADGDGRAEVNEVLVSGLDRPFGLALYPLGDAPTHLYIANTGEILRVPYRSGDLKVSGEKQRIAKLSSGGRLTGGGHWTRDLVFSKDGKTLYASVGSKSNVDDDDAEKDRARILQFDPDGKNERVFAWGIRNPVGLAIDPATGELWTSVNERDGLGDDLPPDYITKVKPNGFYGWPWYYLGSQQDPRHPGKRPDLAEQVIVPDVLIQSHSASLDLAFYHGQQFPDRFRGGIFACLHGSWNRAKRTGYKVIFVPVKNGSADGTYEDFMTGFVTADGKVWGRPVGVTMGKAGELYVSDDGSKSVWKVTYRKK